MEIKKKIFNFGGSAGIIIEKAILENLNLHEGDWVSCNIKKINPTIKIVEKNGKVVEGNVISFRMLENKPALEVFNIEKDKTILLHLDLIKSIEEIK